MIVPTSGLDRDGSDGTLTGYGARSPRLVKDLLLHKSSRSSTLFNEEFISDLASTGARAGAE
jgi:hypothetical protein